MGTLEAYTIRELHGKCLRPDGKHSISEKEIRAWLKSKILVPDLCTSRGTPKFYWQSFLNACAKSVEIKIGAVQVNSKPHKATTSSEERNRKISKNDWDDIFPEYTGRAN